MALRNLIASFLLLSALQMGAQQLPVSIALGETSDTLIAEVAPTVDSLTLYTAFQDDPVLYRLDSMLVLLGLPEMESFKGLAAVDSTPDFPSDELIEQRMALLDARSIMELRYNSTVQRFIELYVKSRKQQMSRMLGEAEYYFPLFEEALDRHGLPLELKYLAVVESALNPQAVSRAKARGLWQFMLPTGRLFGLEVDSYIDKRHDPVQSTEAACAYLKQLHHMFDDWNLALAAYNSGPGNVRKAIRRSGGKRDYWEIMRYLPRETRGYVPAFIAVNYAFAHAQDHGIYAEKAPYAYHQVDTVMIREAMHFDQLGALLDLSTEELERLNPQFIRKYVPASAIEGGAIPLVLPMAKAGLFVSYQDSILQLVALERERKEALGLEEEPVVEQITHKVRSGESLGLIAQRYNVRVSDIMEWNHLRSTVIHAGQRLSIYSSEDKGGNAPSTEKKPVLVESDENTDVYLVQPGDTLYDIAKKYPGVSADHIMQWNDISSAQNLKPGMKIKILKNG